MKEKKEDRIGEELRGTRPKLVKVVLPRHQI